MPKNADHMSYEEHLDEVTTLITEKYDIADDAAIAMVMRAQADDFFSGHDDDESICTLDRASGCESGFREIQIKTPIGTGKARDVVRP